MNDRQQPLGDARHIQKNRETSQCVLSERIKITFFCEAYRKFAFRRKCQLDATEVFIADLIACSTCFGHHYAHHQEL